MFANSLTRDVGLKVGPVMFDVLVQHYFDHIKRDAEKNDRLKQDDVLYHQAFTIVKVSCPDVACFLSDLLCFSNTRTPSPPWTHVVRTLVPLSKCEEAAPYLIKALGGEEVAKRLIGGVKWWQVRGVNGVDAQWITARKDWEESKRRHKLQREKGSTHSSPGVPEAADASKEAVYDKDMDATRCILYLHGGGYYFGSVDQERYSIQRHARKINGRIFAINYRLAPQYPFPCGLQDALAAYLFLIRPPPGSDHQAVNPAHIVISGNSAGGGLTLALLQVIRDSGLPLPAGGILMSPWCDLSHSFPSIHINTKTDVIPDSGLSFHKPSLLWPPPSPEISSRVHASLRHRIRQVFKMEDSHHFNPIASFLSERDANTSTSGVNPSTQSPSDQSRDPQKILITTESGETIEINEQLHFYAQNSLLSHPLVSPVNSYLGGLPPLLFLAGDNEVLRDEIIYCAHKAAHPDRFPITDSARALYPSLVSIEDRYKATSVHLQVYDEAPHILPVLFSFTTPAKFCFRAIASFSRFVTDMAPPSPVRRRQSSSNIPLAQSVSRRPSRKSLKRALSSQLSRVNSVLRGQPSPVHDSPPALPTSATHASSLLSDDVAGPRFQTSSPEPVDERTAGDHAVYSNITQHSSWDCDMIRERVSTKGVVRPLELEAELGAFQLQSQYVGRLSEHTLKRFIEQRDIFNKKFSDTVKSIEKHRRQNLERAKHDTIKRLGFLRQFLHKSDDEAEIKKRKETAILSPGWAWAWALDEEEDPPPSSIVSRRDTEEARKLAEVADQAVLGDDRTMSGNNLWSFVMNLVTATPGRDNHVLHNSVNREADSDVTESPMTLGTAGKEEKPKSRFSRILTHLHREQQTGSSEEKT
ncbi:alpha/beta-hydrolase [Phlegmacium glaucopus]|nr:alpha/beta-hydrolase [Phlegmacium glaucopus]